MAVLQAAAPPAPLAKRQRHLNFTDRVDLGPQQLTLTLARPDAECTEVDFRWLTGEAAGEEHPAGTHRVEPGRFGEAEVFIEARRQTFWQRLSAGRADELAVTCGRGDSIRLDFSEFDSLEGVRFRLKVTSRAPGRESLLLASAKGLRVAGMPNDIEGRSLLPIAEDDLGPRPYRLDFDDGGPLLVLNSGLGPKEAAAQDPSFVSLVYPAIIGQIALRLLAESRHLTDDDLRADDGWRSDWFGFFRDRLKVRRASVSGVNSFHDDQIDDDAASDADWADQVVEAFCGLHNMTDKLLTSGLWTLTEESSDD